jgi:nitrogen-specific signal transduction histidine kinase
MFNNYQNQRAWKYVLLAFAILITGGSLLYTNYLVRNISKAEHTRAEIWALSMKQIVSADDDHDLPYAFSVRDSLVVPAILTDARGDIISANKGLDSTKTYIEDVDAQKNKKSPKYDPQYFKDQLSIMKEQHEPIKVNLPGLGNGDNLIYYKDSELLSELKVFPYIQLSVIAVFGLLAYAMLNSSRRSEQNQVWVGLAKETAHQLGTPISSLMAWVELIKDKFNAEDDPLVAEMENDIQRLEIVADRFSKIGSVPKLEPHSVYLTVCNFMDYFSVRVSKNITFEMHGDPELKANLNVPLFDWVIENLLKNAVNAIDGKGKISVNITTNKTKDQLFVDVIDTGKGIPRSKFATVFQPGYTTRKRGWGLGLSLTKRIVENYHDGHIVVRESELGKGTTFRITLNNIRDVQPTT